MKYGMKDLKVEVLENGCHVCTSHSNCDRYPIITRGGKRYKITRYLYIQKHGSIPNNLILRHTCDNSWCVNVDHLIPGTQKQNVHDCIDRNRLARGEQCGRTKLTTDKVLTIYSMRDTHTAPQLAKQFNISTNTVYRIWYNKTWQHLKR
jgi:hypothetical protein